MAPPGSIGSRQSWRVARATAVSLAVLLGACYGTTPHRAEVATAAAPQQCFATIGDVFSRSGFDQLPTPADLTMFFAPRLRTNYSSFLETGAGIGVTVRQEGETGGTCHVTLEALSPDVGCADVFGPQSGGRCAAESGPGQRVPNPTATNPYGAMLCPTTPPLACALSYAPGADNDAAVDELARRLQAALGAHAHVERASALR